MDNIKDKYDLVGEFHQGVAIVVKDNLYGAVLTGGYEIVPTTYDYISPFKDGYAQAIRNGKCITINLSGKESASSGNKVIEISEKYDEVRGFYNGVACVRKQDKWGVIDDRGKELVSPQFIYISDFIFNLASYKSGNNTWGFISPEGYISKDIYADLEIDVDGSLITSRPILFFVDAFNTKNVGLKKVRLNRDGAVLIQSDESIIALPSYIYFAQNSSEGIICAQNSSGLWGAITCSGEQIIPFEYITIQDFKEGRSFGMDRNGKLHLLSSDGKINKILESYTRATPFVHSYANIYHKDLCGLVDKSGKVVLEPNYTEIRYSGILNSYILIEDGKEGLFNVVTGTKIAPKYKRIVSIEDDYILVEIPVLGTIKIEASGKSFVLHNDHVKYLPEWCIGGMDYENDICYAISKEGKWGIVDQDGNTICKPVFDKIVKREGNLIYTESNKNRDSWKDEIYGLFDIDTKVAIPAEYAEYPQKKDNFYLVCKYDKKNGAVDFNGNEVVNPEYSDVKWLNGYYQIFNEGMVGLVKSDGTIILPPQYCKIEVIKYGLFKVYTQRNSNTWQICNDEGLNHRKYNEIGTINEDGNFPVTYNGRNGLVNTFGQFVISDENNNYILVPEKFKWAENFNNGIAKVWVYDGAHFYYVDRNFNQVLLVDNKAVSIKTEIDRVVYEKRGHNQAFIFKLGDKYGLLSKDGNLLIEPKYFHLDYYSDNLYIVDTKEEYYSVGKYGIIDEKESVILPFEYSNLNEQGEFIISMKTFVHQLKDEYGFLIDSEHIYKYGLIDSKRKTIFEPIFQSIISIDKGFFMLENNIWYIVDKKHFTKKETNYKSIKRLTDHYFEFSITILGNISCVGVLNSSGKECLRPIYTSIGEVNCYKVAVIIGLDGKKGLTDDNYRILVEPQYDYVSEFMEGRATVEKRVTLSGDIIRGEIDTMGNFIEISELTEYDISNGKTKQIKTLSNGHIVLMKDNPNPSFQYCAVVDRDNNIILPYKYHRIEELEDGSYRGYAQEKGYNSPYKTLDENFNEVKINKDFNESAILAGDVAIPINTIKIQSNECVYPYEPASEGIVWIYENNREKIGLATTTGELLIEPSYGKVEPFVMGYAKVNNGYWSDAKKYGDYSCYTKRTFINGKWGVIDSSGKLVIPMEYDSINIEEDLSFTVTKSILDYVSWLDAHYIQVAGRLNKNGELIIKNEKGEYILADKRFDWQEDFSANGLSKVYYQERIGFVNKNSQLIVESLIIGSEIYDLIIPKDFEWGYYCSDKVFIGLKNDKWGVFCYDGLVIIPAEYDSIVLENGVYIVHRKNKTGVLTETGDTIIKIEYDMITFKDGVYLVHRDNKTGIISEKGDIIVDVEFDTIKIISPIDTQEKFYLCTKQGRNGLYNSEGKELLPTEYKHIQFIGYDLLTVQGIDGKFKLFDKKGKCVNDIVLDEICLFGDRNKSNYGYNESKVIEDALYTIVKKEGLYGAINAFGELVLPTRYKELHCVNKNVFYGDFHYIDSHGRRVAFLDDEIVFIADDYDSAVLLENGLILVARDRLYGCINKKGDVIIPIQYQKMSCSGNLFAASIYDEKIKTRKYGVLNILNKEVVPLNNTYEDIKIENGLILYRVGRFWGAFTLYGKLICEPKYSHIKPLTEYLIKVGIDYSIGWNNSSETYWGVINVDGEELLTIDRYKAKQTICDRLFNGFIEYYVDGNRIGYLDITGRVVLKPIYTEIGEFIDGYAIVAKTKYYTDYDDYDRKKNIYGVIDNSFNEVIPCAFNRIEYEPELGLFETDLGYKTSDGRFIAEVDNEKLFVNAKYNHCEAFHDGCAIAVQTENNKIRYGLINTKSEDILPPIFQWLKLSDNGLYKFKMNEKYGFVDNNGKIVISNKYHRIGKFEDDLAVVTVKMEANGYGKGSCLYGFIDNRGKEILPSVYEYMGKKSEGKVVLMKNNIWGIFDIKTKEKRTVLNADYIGICKEGICRFNVGGTFDKSTSKITGGTWGYITPKGQILISPIYENVLGFSDGIAAIKQNGKWGFIDINGVIVVPCKYDEVEASFENGEGKLVKDDKIFVFDKSGSQIDTYDEPRDDDYYYDGGYYNDTPSIYDNPYYNDNLDMDQQSIEFWNSL